MIPGKEEEEAGIVSMRDLFCPSASSFFSSPFGGPSGACMKGGEGEGKEVCCCGAGAGRSSPSHRVSEHIRRRKGEKEKMPGMGTEKREKDVSNHEG